MMKSGRRLWTGALAVALTASLAACSGGGSDTPDPLAAPQAGTLRVLAGSELADLGPILADAEQATGVHVVLDPVGSIDGADQVATGAAAARHDAIWFSSNRYLALRPGAQAQLGTSVNTMSSPVVLGLRRSVAQQLGWVGKPVSWSDIAAAAGAKKFTFGMTDPSASNSGFSTVVAVATALVGSGAALTAEQATSTSPALTAFYSAQNLSSGSSGFLQDAYTRRATGADPGPPVDGLVNYESVLLELNASNKLPEPLEIIRPSDGVVTADYPFTVLAGASAQARDDARKLTDYLRTPDVQRKIMDQTFRRPAVPGVPLAQVFGTSSLVELPFPTDAKVVDTLLTSWFDKVRKPSRTIYVLDTSGSMSSGGRIEALRSALTGLSGADASLVGQFRRFRGREEVTFLPFSGTVGTQQNFVVSPDDPGPDLAKISAAAQALSPSGATAIYDALASADQTAEQEITAARNAGEPDRFTSIVLMTDGQNTTGSSIDDFTARVASRPPDLKGVPVFCVLFGEGSNDEMTRIAQTTGGRTFDARKSSLSEVFKEIRGYV
jgi:Ca-activated chloride channel homolog